MARRERRGPFAELFVLMVGALSIGCGEEDPAPKTDDAGPSCPHDDTTVVALTGVSPALGASVTNNAIVHTFTTVGVDAYFSSLRIAQLASHTAGSPTGTLMFTVAPMADGSVVYTFMPLSWPTAPAHVGFFDASVYEDPNDGCKIALPSPLFEYDVVP